MANTSVFKVQYHFETAGKKTTGEYVDYVSAAANDEATIQAVLTSNGKQFGAGTRKISQIVNVGPGGPAGSVLS